MVKEITKNVGLPFTDIFANQWYQVYLQSLNLVDLSLFSHRENNGIIKMGGGTVSYNNVTNILGWTSPIQILHPFSGKKNEIPIGNIKVELGSYLYCKIKRTLIDNGGIIPISNLVTSKTVENSEFFMLLFYVTELGEIITDIESSISVTPITNNVYRDLEVVSSYDFPNNPENVVSDNIDTVIVSDKNYYIDKGIRAKYRISKDVANNTDFWLGFFYKVEVLTAGQSLNFDIEVNRLRGGVIGSQNILSMSYSLSPIVSSDLILFVDTNKFKVNPNDIIQIDILFKNSNQVTDLGSSSDVFIYNLLLIS